MKGLFSIFRRKSGTPGEGSEKIRSIFSKFQMILDLNTKILEKMAVMERPLGGEFIFDKSFLETSVNEVSPLVYQVVYSLNAMTGNRFPELYDSYQTIRGYLEDIISGGPGPNANRLTMPYPVIRMEMQPIVGLLSAELSELGYHMGIHVPEGFAITVTAVRQFMEDNDLDGKIKAYGRTPWSPDKKERIAELFSDTWIRQELEEAVSAEISHLMKQIGRTSALTVTAGLSGEKGHGVSFRMDQVSSVHVLDAFRNTLAGLVIRVLKSDPAVLFDKTMNAAIAVQKMIPYRISGTVMTLDPLHTSQQMARITVLNPGGEDTADSFLVQRFYPFDVAESSIRVKNPADSLPDRKTGLSVLSSGRRRGSSLIRKYNLIALVESAMAVERTYEKPRKVHWIEDESGRIVVTGTDDLSVPAYDEISMDELNRQVENAVILLQGGDTAQMGVASGRVVHVSDESGHETFPLGAIAVARKASPHLSPILRRAAGLITETGSPVGHLAAIAREVRIPAIVGVPKAMDILTDGMSVTLDTGERKVYQGILELLVRYRSSGIELYPTDPEYIALSQLLRLIIPLNLTDPSSDEFKSGNCRTYHDILHFAHEKAVEELLNIQSRHKELKGISTRRLSIHVPIDIRVMDLGNGVIEGKDKDVMKEDIISLPFKAFLKGITMEDIWDLRPSSIGLREIFSGMDRTWNAMSSMPEYSGQNLAIVAEHYLNLTLRLGYHFNVINAYLSENQNKNFIYFRFVGGFAGEEKRQRRARFIAAILENMEFKVNLEGDLVIGTLKIADHKKIESSLIRLGELTGFTRQLDTKMNSGGDVDEFIRLFNERVMTKG